MKTNIFLTAILGLTIALPSYAANWFEERSDTRTVTTFNGSNGDICIDSGDSTHGEIPDITNANIELIGLIGSGFEFDLTEDLDEESPWGIGVFGFTEDTSRPNMASFGGVTSTSLIQLGVKNDIGGDGGSLWINGTPKLDSGQVLPFIYNYDSTHSLSGSGIGCDQLERPSNMPAIIDVTNSLSNQTEPGGNNRDLVWVFKSNEMDTSEKYVGITVRYENVGDVDKDIFQAVRLIQMHSPSTAKNRGSYGVIEEHIARIAAVEVSGSKPPSYSLEDVNMGSNIDPEAMVCILDHDADLQDDLGQDEGVLEEGELVFRCKMHS